MSGRKQKSSPTTCLANRGLHSLVGAGMEIVQYSMHPAVRFKSSSAQGVGAVGCCVLRPGEGRGKEESAVLADIWKTFSLPVKRIFPFTCH